MAHSPLNVLFLTLYPEVVASARYRVHQFLPYLRERGMHCTVMSALSDAEYSRLTDGTQRPFWYHAKETPRRISQLLSAQRYDIVVVQKALTTAYLRGLHGLLRARARKLVYDIDDAVHIASPHPLRGVWRGLEDRGQIARIVRDADLVLAGNRWLCEEMKTHARRVEHFPTVVDTQRFTPPTSPPHSFCIGWMGSPSTTPLLEVARTIGDVTNARIRCVGADAEQVPWARADVVPWSFETEVDEIQKFFVGIMPLKKDEWTRGKCALKALQYMACGILCVATPFGAVLDIVRDGENGMFADNPNEWCNCIEQVRDPVLRARLGAAARAAVEAEYSLAIAAPRLAALLESVA